MLVATTLILASAGAFNSAMKATDRALETEEASVFLETTLENVLAQPYGNLLTLNGNTVFDVTDANDSDYRVDLTVFQAEVNLIQIDAVITDLSTGRVMGRLTTLRSNR